MNDPDPAQVASLEELAECLRQLHIRADKPSLRELEDRTKHANGLLPGTQLNRVRLARTTVNDVLRGFKLPKKAFLLTLVETLHVNIEADRRWEQAWDRLAVQNLDQAAAMEAEQLRQELAGAKARADRTDGEAEQLREQLAAAQELVRELSSRGYEIDPDHAMHQARTTAHTEQLTSSPSAPLAGALRMDPIRVLIADDHTLFRHGLEMVLEEEGDIDLVGHASDGAEAVAVAGELLPDVVLMEVRMPKSSGIEACRTIKEVAPNAKIVMLTISDEEEDLFEAIRAGASGYLLKDIPPDEVAEAVRAVHGGQSLINPSMAGKLLTELATVAKQNAEAPAPKLTDREMEVLKLVARGMNNRDIAKELFISENTVKNHVRNILEKLQIHSRMEAVIIAIRQKLIEFS